MKILNRPLRTKAKLKGLAVAAGLIFIAAPVLFASPLQPVSTRSPGLPVPPGGNADSVSGAVSADGRFVLFSSSANNLVPGDNGQLGLDVFLRDRASNTTTLVSANYSGTGGGNGNSLYGQVSTNGRYVVFQSDATDLLPGDTNGVTDIFVRDLQLGSNILVSVAADGSWGNGASTDPVMTPDGRYVVFISAATNLVAGDMNGIADVFMRDLVGGTTALVSVGATGASGTNSTPVITPDGRYVAFASPAQGLARGVPAATTGEVYVRDVVGNVTTWASTNAANLVSQYLHINNTPSSHPVISDNGQFVSFKTGRTTTGSNPQSETLVIQYNVSTATTTIISSNGFPPWDQNDDVYGPEMSPDGRFVAFVATNTIGTSVQLWDAQAGSNVLVSVAVDGSFPTNSISDAPAVSPDGRYVTFVSTASNLVTNTVVSGFHIYRRDLQAGITQLVDADTNGVGSINPVMTVPTLSADGRFVTFASADAGLVDGGQNGTFDVFLRDVTGGTTELISAASPGLIPQTGDGWSFLGQPALSDDGQKIVFTSAADDLAPNDVNGSPDVFLYDVAAGTNALVSVGLDGNPAAGASFSPALALGGQLVAFVSTATNLVAGATNGFANVYVRDMLAGSNDLISVAPGGIAGVISAGNADSAAPAISQDGRYVVFTSRASNLASGASASTANVYLRDRNAGTTLLLNNSALATQPPSISADGRYVSYVTSGSQAVVRDTELGANVFTASSAAAAVVSPSGARLLLASSTGTALSVFNLLNQSNLFTVAARSPMKLAVPWSTDGRYFTFVTSTNADPRDANGTNDIYLCDLSSNTLTLVSINATQTGAGSDVSDSPAISGDGRFVIYRSFATNLVAGPVNPPPNIYLYDRFTGSNSWLTTAAPGSTWSSWTAQPGINGDGRVMIFQSWNPAIVAGDLNRVEDIFTGALSPWGAADSGGDGIPDSWRIYYFGHPTGMAADLSRAQDDADGTGMSNLQKFLAGLDPLDPSANLRLQIQAQIVSPGNVTFNWSAVPGKHYGVQYNPTLDADGWIDVPGAAIVGLQGTVTVPLTQPGGFYRVTVD